MTKSLSLLTCLLLSACSSGMFADGMNFSEPNHGLNAGGHFDGQSATIDLTPLSSVNPVGSQHVVVATVKDAQGRPVPSARVEWMLDGQTGVIVDVDHQGVYAYDGDLIDAGLPRHKNGGKVDNTYAVSHTNDDIVVLCMGTEDESDDVTVGRGQTYAVITSGNEGTTNIIAYAPGIPYWADHKAFAHKHWMDVEWKMPGNATNKVGVAHPLSTVVMKPSDGSPIKDYQVTYRILSGPAATLEPGGGQFATVSSDANGIATATLKQAKPMTGVNTIAISIVRPGNEKCCLPDKPIADGQVTKTWVAPTIDIKKTAPAKAGINDTFAYSITVTSSAALATDKVVVTDKLPDGIQHVSSTPPAKVDGQTLSWDLGTLAAGGVSRLSVNVKATKTGTFSNCAEVTAEAGLTAKSCADTLVTAPALSLAKTGPTDVLICDTINYKYVVKNNGDGAANDVKIVDVLPEGLMATGNKTSLEMVVGKLEAGQSKEFTAQARASKTGKFTNKATATAAGGLKAESSVTTAVHEPVLVIEKTGTKTSFMGRPITYDITVKNTGDAAAKETMVVDTAPAGVTFKSATEGGTFSGGTVRWSLGTLEPGQSRKLSVTFTAATGGTLVNTAKAEAVCAKPVTATAQTEVTGIAAILLELVDTEDPIEVGGNEVYRIEVTNQGSADDNDVVIECTLPAEMTYVSSTGPSAGTASGQKVSFAPLARIAPKAKVTWTLTVKATAVGDVRFGVSLRSKQLKTPVSETESTTIY